MSVVRRASGKVILPKRSANTTSVHITTGPPWLNQTTEFRAIVNGGVSSNVATVTVKARLSKPTARIWRTGRVFDSNVTVHGLDLAASREGHAHRHPYLLEVGRWRMGSAARSHGQGPHQQVALLAALGWSPEGLRLQTAVPVPLANLKGSGKTQWRVQASHEDTSHALSQSATTMFWVR